MDYLIDHSCYHVQYLNRSLLHSLLQQYIASSILRCGSTTESLAMQLTAAITIVRFSYLAHFEHYHCSPQQNIFMCEYLQHLFAQFTCTYNKCLLLRSSVDAECFLLPNKSPSYSSQLSVYSKMSRTTYDVEIVYC